MKIVSYNVNGLRPRVASHGSLRKLLDSLQADIVCFQEIKLSRRELSVDITVAEGYESFFSCTRTTRKGRIRYSVSVEGGSIEHDTKAKEVTELLNGGLEDKALAVLKDLLLSKQPSSLDQVAGYKSVLKTVMSTFIAAYDIANQMDNNIFSFLLDIFCEIYSGQESLCLEFWDRDSVLNGPIRSLLFAFSDRFPYQTLPIIRLLSTLCEGTWSAECVYDFLYRMTGMTSLVQSRGFSYVNNDSQTVKAHISLQVPGAPGLVIPVGTIGHVIKIVDEDVFVVHWEALTLKLLELDSSPIVQTALCNGCMEKALGVDALKIVCTLINNFVPINKDSRVLALCISILCNFFECFPSRAASQIFKTLLFQFPTKISSSDVWLLPEVIARLLSVDGDQSAECHILTISILDFCKIVVSKGMQTESIIALVIYAVRYLLVNHGSWKYKFKYEHWELMSKVKQFTPMSTVGQMSQILFVRRLCHSRTII